LLLHPITEDHVLRFRVSALSVEHDLATFPFEAGAAIMGQRVPQLKNFSFLATAHRDYKRVDVHNHTLVTDIKFVVRGNFHQEEVQTKVPPQKQEDSQKSTLHDTGSRTKNQQATLPERERERERKVNS